MSKTTTTALILTLTIISAAAQAPSPAEVGTAEPPSGASAPFAPLGPSGASGPSAVDECLGPVANMSGCLEFVTQGSNLTKPAKNCCPELAGLIESNPVCLCKLLGSNIAAQYGITIDLARALKLPSVCKIQTPDVSLCSAVGYPVGAPSSQGPTAPGVMPPSGLAANPSSGGKDTGGASSIAGPAYAFSVALTSSFLLTFFF